MFPWPPRTTLRLGGRARYFWSVSSADEAAEALRWARANRQSVQVLGGGSNTIFPDDGFPGLVLHVDVPGLRFRESDGAVVVDAGAGESVDRGLTGIECLSGIPGTVGAAPIQNVGAYGQELSATLVHVDCLDRETLERQRIPGAECGFDYRWSRFKGEDRGRFLILGVRLRLERGRTPELRYEQLEREVERRGGIDGLTPAEAVAGATREAARVLGLAGERGGFLFALVQLAQRVPGLDDALQLGVLAREVGEAPGVASSNRSTACSSRLSRPAFTGPRAGVSGPRPSARRR